VFVNPATQTTTGYALDEVREPATWQKLIHPDDLPGLLSSLREGLDGKSGRSEARYRAKDGQERFAYCLAQPIVRPLSVVRGPLHSGEHRAAPGTPPDQARDDREVIGVTVLVLDMTRERRLEMELQRAQRLELVGRLSSGIAHDFNNLLTVLLGMAELARNGLPPVHPVQQDLQRISEVGEQAINLARQILAFSKQSKVAFQTVEVNRAVHRVVNILRTLLPRTVEVETTLAEGGLLIHADEMQLQQVLMNLCLNARDAMPNGGKLLIRTHLLRSGVVSGEWSRSSRPGMEITSREGQGAADHPPTTYHSPLTTWVCLSVEDNGQGMTEEIRRRIFEPFFSTRERGTGLGLAVVHQIITSFGGHVDVQSEPGRGTCLDVWLPLSGSATP